MTTTMWHGQTASDNSGKRAGGDYRVQGHWRQEGHRQGVLHICLHLLIRRFLFPRASWIQSIILQSNAGAFGTSYFQDLLVSTSVVSLVEKQSGVLAVRFTARWPRQNFHRQEAVRYQLAVPLARGELEPISMQMTPIFTCPI